MLISEKELTETNYERLKEAIVYKNNNLKEPDSNVNLTVGSLIGTKNIITGASNITLRKVNAKSHGFDKVHIEKDLLEDRLYQITDQFNEKKITPAKFYLLFLHEIHSFYDGNGKLCKELFANDYEINLLIR